MKKMIRISILFFIMVSIFNCEYNSETGASSENGSFDVSTKKIRTWFHRYDRPGWSFDIFEIFAHYDPDSDRKNAITNEIGYYEWGPNVYDNNTIFKTMYSTRYAWFYLYVVKGSIHMRFKRQKNVNSNWVTHETRRALRGQAVRFKGTSRNFYTWKLIVNKESSDTRYYLIGFEK